MGENNNSVFGALTLLISDIALLGAAFMVFSIRRDSESLSIGVLPWLVMASASFALYRAFLRRERTLLQAVLFLAALYAATVAVLLIFFVHLPSFISTMIALIFWAVPLFRIYTATQTPPTFEKLAQRLEGLIVFILFQLLSIVGLGLPPSSLIPCVTSMLLCFASLIVIRTSRSSAGEGSGMRGATVVVAFFLLIGVVIAAFLLFASASFGEMVAEGSAAIIRGIKLLFNLLWRALNWLISLLPMPDYAGELPQGTSAMEGSIAATETVVYGSNITLTVILCVIAAAIAAIVITAVIRYRRVTFGGARKQKTSGIKRRKPRTRNSLLRRCMASLRFFGYSILYRNTPQGVFVYLERWGRSRRCGRAPGETHRSYLTRLSANAPGQKTVLLRLADALDARWYGDPALSQLPGRELVGLRRFFSVASPRSWLY